MIVQQNRLKTALARHPIYLESSLENWFGSRPMTLDDMREWVAHRMAVREVLLMACARGAAQGIRWCQEWTAFEMHPMRQQALEKVLTQLDLLPTHYSEMLSEKAKQQITERFFDGKGFYHPETFSKLLALSYLFPSEKSIKSVLGLLNKMRFRSQINPLSNYLIETLNFLEQHQSLREEMLDYMAANYPDAEEALLGTLDFLSAYRTAFISYRRERYLPDTDILNHLL